MREKKLEQVLEEALSAYIEEGRPLDDILREYAAYRGHLEPLMQTAIETYETLQREDPSAWSMGDGLERFLEAARARADIRYLQRRDHSN
jgi:hypothetical protein